MKGNVVVGEDARAALVAMPDRTVAAVKRKMGSGERIAVAGKEFLPQEISALILKELKKYVDSRFGEGEKEAVITVPAYFNDDQRRATKQAGELAGFVVDRIINEPTAAAMAYGLEHLEEDRHILVYDLGGGTFDVSIVEMMDGVLEVKASSGNSRLGGEDFDWKIVDWLAEQVINEHGTDPRDDIRAKALLKEEAEKIKKRLSEEESVNVSLPLVTVKDNRPASLFAEFTRNQLVEIIDGMLSETLDCVRQVLKDAGLAPGDMHEILLVGGSTRIPRVHELIRDFFRDSQEAFEESRERLEALCRGAGSGDMDDDLDEEDVDLFDGMAGYESTCDDGENEDLSPTVLHSEAAALRRRAVELLESASRSDRLKVEKIIGLLDEAMSGDDIDRLRSAIDEAADALIDLEF